MKWVSICVLGWGLAAHSGNDSRCFSKTQDLAEAFCWASSFVWQCAQRFQALASKAAVAVCWLVCVRTAAPADRCDDRTSFSLLPVCSLQHLCVVAGYRQVMAGADSTLIPFVCHLVSCLCCIVVPHCCAAWIGCLTCWLVVQPSL